MLPKKTIALDLDSVLADVMLIWVEEYNIIFHTNIRKKDIFDWHIHNVLPISKNQISELFISVWKNRWRDIPPTSNDVTKVINGLMEQGFRISIITKRERVTMPFVSYWLDLHKISFNDIIFIFDDAPKSCFPFFLLVDDSPINAKEIMFPKRIVVFDQPWNRGLESFPRIMSLNQLFSLL